MLIVCHECDALQRISTMPEGAIARCVGCGAMLYRNPAGDLNRPLALLLAAFVFYLLGNTFPLLTLDIGGQVRDSTLSGAAFALYQADMLVLATLVLVTAVLAPGMLMLGSLYVLTALHFRLALPGLRPMLTALSHLRTWEMADVFVLGVLVAMVKLSADAETLVGAGLYALIVSVGLALAARSNMDFIDLWRTMEKQKP
jgi:paraquat-inducible protein A